jgi:hypothetical protein
MEQKLKERPFSDWAGVGEVRWGLRAYTLLETEERRMG